MQTEYIPRSLAQNKRIAVILRHAERPPLQFGDRTFGKTLPLTDKGIRDATKLGRHLATLCAGKSISLYHGESLRCRMTAEAISMAITWSGLETKKLPFLGGASPFFADVDERMKLASSGDYLSSLNEYFASGRQKGFHPLSCGFKEFDSLIVGNSIADITIFVTHDLNLACYMAGSGICTRFTSSTWPRYLDYAVREII